MSDPLEKFENKLKEMSVKELEIYLKRLDEKIKHAHLAGDPIENIFALYLYRRYLDREIKSRVRTRTGIV